MKSTSHLISMKLWLMRSVFNVVLINDIRFLRKSLFKKLSAFKVNYFYVIVKKMKLRFFISIA